MPDKIDIYLFNSPAPERAALLEHQLELEELYDKNQTVPRIRKEFTGCKEFDFEQFMLEREIHPDLGFDLLTQMVLHKRTTLPTLVGILRRHFEGDPNASQLTANELFKCADADLVDWSPTAQQFIVKIDISADVQADIERFQYPLPMVIPPRSVTTNSETGYLRGKGSIILRKNHHEDDVCLDHINRVNRIKFCLDHRTAHMISNQWRNLDKPKSGETQEDFNKRKRAFEKYDRSAKDVMDLLLIHGNEFYLTHRYDKRGRVYCQGYHVNYQGAPWNKAVIELANKEIVP
jgi:hypothetical protein